MNPSSAKTDQEWMRLAIAEASKGLGRCAPNPAVGAVIVSDGELIGKGHHKGAGLPHAEREALADASNRFPDKIAGATAYVTLEPCSTHGRTPPCCDALIEAGIRRCVYASTDPDPRHVGAADRRLSGAGIEVLSGVLAKEADELIRGFRSVKERGRPWIISKLGMSLDGRLSRPPGESQWLTNPTSRQQVQALRSEVDAILVGANTVRRDNPKLTLRGEWANGRRQPLRVVLLRDRKGIPPTSHLLTDPHADRTLLLEQLTPAEALHSLATKHEINTVLLEAGPTLQGLFFDLDLVDEVRFFYAPLLCGGPDVAIGGSGVDSVIEGERLTDITWQVHGDDLEMRALVSPKQRRLT